MLTSNRPPPGLARVTRVQLAAAVTQVDFGRHGGPPPWPNGPWLHLPGFADRVDFPSIRHELAEAAGRHATRRDLTIPETANTARRMSNLSARAVEVICPATWSLYTNPSVLWAIEAHTAVAPLPLRDDIEAVVVNYLHEYGDTHGAHHDDHEVAFVLIVEAPPPGHGGELVLEEPDGSRSYVTLAEGDAYILHASEIAHAVAPVTGRRRIAVVCAYDLAGRPQPHRTTSAAQLYG